MTEEHGRRQTDREYDQLQVRVTDAEKRLQRLELDIIRHITALLCKAIQEQQALIVALTARVAALEK